MRSSCLLLCAAFCLPAAADESVVDLIRAMGSDSPAERDRAQAELERRGADTVPELERAIGDPSLADPEIQARLIRIVERSRRAEAWAEDPMPLARDAVAEEACANCRNATCVVDGEVTGESFAVFVEDVKLFRIRCARCNPSGRGRESTAVLFLRRDGDSVLLRRGNIAGLTNIAVFLRPVVTAESARRTAAALVAVARHAASPGVRDAALRSSGSAPRNAGGFQVRLTDLGDEVILDFDETGNLVGSLLKDG
jgi:hypothetical protein